MIVSENIHRKLSQKADYSNYFVRYEAQAYDGNNMLSFEKPRLCIDEEAESCDEQEISQLPVATALNKHVKERRPRN